jgi:hypothetical protein
MSHTHKRRSDRHWKIKRLNSADLKTVRGGEHQSDRETIEKQAQEQAKWFEDFGKGK